LAFGDLNNDGRIDAIVNNVGEAPTVLINTTANGNKSLTLKLVQAGSNQFSIGARAILKTDRRSMIRNVEAGASYLSQNDLRIHFGIPEGEKIESLTVRWDDGKDERINGAEIGKILTIRKGSGVIGRRDYRKSGQ
jgi:hypothetical protein